MTSMRKNSWNLPRWFPGICRRWRTGQTISPQRRRRARPWHRRQRRQLWKRQFWFRLRSRGSGPRRRRRSSRPPRQPWPECFKQARLPPPCHAHNNCVLSCHSCVSAVAAPAEASSDIGKLVGLVQCFLSSLYRKAGWLVWCSEKKNMDFIGLCDMKKLRYFMLNERDSTIRHACKPALNP